MARQADAVYEVGSFPEVLMSTRRVLTFIFALATALAGCTSNAPAAPTQTSGTSTPAPSIAPSFGLPIDGEAPHQVPELEAMLPSDVLGVPVRKASVSGQQAIEELNIPNPVLDAITLMGRSRADIQVALGAAEDDSFVMTAIRVPRMDAQTMRATIVAANDRDVLPVREGQIAGKSVSSLGDSQFYYATGDILFSVFGDANVANEIISKLP
jgi:hypothetical protein